MAGGGDVPVEVVLVEGKQREKRDYVLHVEGGLVAGLVLVGADVGDCLRAPLEPVLEAEGPEVCGA